MSLRDELILIMGGDLDGAAKANMRLENAIPRLRERYEFLQMNSDAFTLGGQLRADMDGGDPDGLAAIPAIVGLAFAGRERYREIARREPLGLD